MMAEFDFKKNAEGNVVLGHVVNIGLSDLQDLGELPIVGRVALIGMLLEYAVDGQATRVQLALRPDQARTLRDLLEIRLMEYEAGPLSQGGERSSRDH